MSYPIVFLELVIEPIGNGEFHPTSLRNTQPDSSKNSLPLEDLKADAVTALVALCLHTFLNGIQEQEEFRKSSCSECELRSPQQYAKKLRAAINNNSGKLLKLFSVQKNQLHNYLVPSGTKDGKYCVRFTDNVRVRIVGVSASSSSSVDTVIRLLIASLKFLLLSSRRELNLIVNADQNDRYYLEYDDKSQSPLVSGDSMKIQFYSNHFIGLYFFFVENNTALEAFPGKNESLKENYDYDNNPLYDKEKKPEISLFLPIDGVFPVNPRNSNEILILLISRTGLTKSEYVKMKATLAKFLKESRLSLRAPLPSARKISMTFDPRDNSSKRPLAARRLDTWPNEIFNELAFPDIPIIEAQFILAPVKSQKGFLP